MFISLAPWVVAFLLFGVDASEPQCGTTQTDVYLRGCAAYSWMPPSDATLTGGHCHLKNRAESSTPMAGAVSGQVTGVAPSKCPYFLVTCNTTGACALFASDCTLAAPACVPGAVVCPGAVSCVPPGSGFLACPSMPPFYNTSLPLDFRVAAVVGALSLEQIGLQLVNLGYGAPGAVLGAPGEPTLGLPPYNWLNEGLHGVARAGFATSMPQISVIGCTFNRSVFRALGQTLGLEARARHTMERRTNDTAADYRGITYYAPNINLGRDPRWGRIQEVPTEDPRLMAAYATAVAQAAQAPSPSDPSGPSAIAACCKHWLAYSVEGGTPGSTPRDAFNAVVSGHDLLESYMPAFQACFMQGQGRSSMCSYNAVNGVPTCASNFGLNLTIRGRYGRGDGVFIVSDYGAVEDGYSPHHYCATEDECTAASLRSGVDQDGGGSDFRKVASLVASGLLTDAEVRRAAARLFSARVELGLLDPPEASPFLQDLRELDSDANRAASADAARQGIVLLSNPRGTLPLALGALQGVAIVGPNADNAAVLLGNYQGTPPFIITLREGLVRALGGNLSAVPYAPGCADVPCASTSGFPAAVAAAESPSAGAIIAVVGLDETQEAEGLDRVNLTLPGQQLTLLQALLPVARARGVPFIVALVTGGPLDVAWALENADAVVLVGYASQAAGDAFADVLSGRYAPAGRLAVTWPRSIADLPPMPDMALPPSAGAGTPGRTYRYAQPPPLLPFGHGLGYSTFAYDAPIAAPAAAAGAALAVGTAQELGGARHVSPPPVLTPSRAAAVPPCAGVNVSVTLHNVGAVASGEVVQVYLNLSAASVAALPAGWVVPRWWLAEFDRVALAPGGSAALTFTLPPRALAVVNGSAAATFGQNFSVPAHAVQAVLSGAAFGLERDFTAAAAAAGAGAIGWDDMWALPNGAEYDLWVGGGQPGYGAPGAAGSFTTAGSLGTFENLAECLVRAAARGK